MKINILYGVEQAKEAKGLTVVIDVFRAFTTVCYISSMGAKEIIVTKELDNAYNLKKNNSNYILIGERNGYIQAGFDYGNSPFQLQQGDFRDKTIIFTTTLGTQGLINSFNRSNEVITGSFVNCGAVVKYIQQKKPNDISFVCTGIYPNIIGEDEIFANYLKSSLLNKKVDFEKIKNRIRNSSISKPFFDPLINSHPEEDFEFCITSDKFNFVLKAEYEKDEVKLKKIENY